MVMLTVVLTLLAAVLSAAFVTRSWSFSDLAVYRWGGGRVFDGLHLYQDRDPVSGLAFTYPPFAALVFHVLALGKLMTNIGFTIVSLAALARAAWLVALRMDGRIWLVALGLAAATLLTEPGEQNLGLGQISFILLWLVLEGTIGPRRHWGAVALGLAAAIKLTPALFVVWLLVVLLIWALWAMWPRSRRAVGAAAAPASSAAAPAGRSAVREHGADGVTDVVDLEQEAVVAEVRPDRDGSIA